jgi:type IV pilus modification protein PilV
MKARIERHCRAGGYTLVEALVALVLLSAGLLVAAMTTLHAVRMERESATRGAALRLASSLGEDLRALPRPDGRALLAPTGLAAASACANHPPSCAAEAAAAERLAEFLAQVALVLPAGSAAQVEVPDLNRPAYRIELRWPAAGAEMLRLRLAVDT